MISRKQARDLAYKLVFQYLFSQEENSKFYEMVACADMADTEREYIDRVYFGIVEHKAELTETVSRFAKNFSVDRINRADMAALLLAIYEMYYEKDIPLSVSISEAVELVKVYSTEKSYQFVNGILSAIYKEMNGKKGK